MVIASNLFDATSQTTTRKSTNKTPENVFERVVSTIDGANWIIGSIDSPIHKGQYTAFFEQDVDDGGLVVTIPSLPGCVTEADNLDKAYEFLKDALHGWIEVAQAKGLEIPGPDIE